MAPRRFCLGQAWPFTPEKGAQRPCGPLTAQTLCRQQKLEEQLLFSGCFSDDLQSLLDWLCRVEPQLAEETPVAGDRDLVGMLMEQHKVGESTTARCGQGEEEPFATPLLRGWLEGPGRGGLDVPTEAPVLPAWWRDRG